VLSWSFDLFFQSSGITSYAAVEGSAIRSDLDAVTVAMWLRTSDRLNQGTPLSYATDQRDNELAVTDYNGFVIYVAGQDKVTDVSVVDGTWHHVAVTWQSPDGVWNIYKDGEAQDGGRGLATGLAVKGSVGCLPIYLCCLDQELISYRYSSCCCCCCCSCSLLLFFFSFSSSSSSSSSSSICFLFGTISSKSLRLRYFKSDRDEI